MLIKILLWTTVSLMMAGGAATAGALMGSIILKRFQETFLILFGFYPKLPWESAPPDQQNSVDHVLTCLAIELNMLLADTATVGDITRIDQVRLTFQLSQNVAAAHGFETRGTYNEYLTKAHDTQPL